MSLLRALKNIIFADPEGVRRGPPPHDDTPDESRDVTGKSDGAMTRSQFLSELERLTEAK